VRRRDSFAVYYAIQAYAWRLWLKSQSADVSAGIESGRSALWMRVRLFNSVPTCSFRIILRWILGTQLARYSLNLNNFKMDLWKTPYDSCVLFRCPCDSNRQRVSRDTCAGFQPWPVSGTGTGSISDFLNPEAETHLKTFVVTCSKMEHLRKQARHDRTVWHRH
jgi:hypothetical protein